ncbi:MAG: ribonucleoside-diphosphate reductase subunit alpha [Moraxellaceae bacterium]|jgi:ribonucleoside-diphosphate reductase alpha chain|nr:ribonucleoside-diphosphate reductase subunit alpha [Moraxellaceae bacterium]MBP8852462.1 ribonucleoside-diphosphate reductase subunit alpha [Moraxellaceae bacterium]MBP9045865.1 ribonucleoside-diphosphate reductase subunit alpha [Moraxellaceae bacterium]MBP9730810.1 ribonucleoside-diphosphate reductase subunit alpha [Moraxellaceae bacterium]MCC6201193.1 ribonucleoside-diphosphate reductase subunit alpha [Moraxellaceae bacterium]
MQLFDLPLTSSSVREDAAATVFSAHGHSENLHTGTLKSIIKRDGRIEPYTPKKLNGWGRWAASAIGSKVDWSSIVINAVNTMPAVVSSGQLQEKLIQNCLDKETWSYYLMAGRLYASHLHKMIHDLTDSSIKQLHERMANDGIMLRLDYDAAEYAQIEKFIDHERDYDTPYFSLHYIRRKYSLQNRTTGQEYETQQFVYMRMAMALAENEPKAQRLDLVRRYYNEFADKLMSAPTPNYVNLGTRLRGFASCCLYVTDDNEQSLAIGDHIAYRMTAASAGIGSHYITRSKGDPVRGGLIEHQGKLPYFASLGKAVNANMQAGRGGACTTYYSGFDPEAEVISYLRNPRSTEDRKNRDLHYALVTNRLFAEKVAKNEDAFSFNVFTAPKLARLFFSSDADGFKKEYERLEQDPTFKKNYFNPRDLILTSLNEALETGVAYLANIDEMNRHTPFIEPIHSSNLCLEICEPNRPYQDMRDLYSDKEVGYITVATVDGAQQRFNFNEPLALDDGRVIFAGHLKVGDIFLSRDQAAFSPVAQIIDTYAEPEVALCSLGAIACDRIAEDDDEAYQEAMYLTLKMIDYCIENTHYVLPHIGITAKARMNAGVGLMGVASRMARKNLRYDTREGREELHRIAERHMYHAIRASLRISKERGKPRWIHKTRWPEGWLPIDTYNRNVDELGDFKCRYDWEALRAEIIENGGIGHSCLVAYMPGESSSKALGLPNSIYPVRSTTLSKTDGNVTIRWAAPSSDDSDHHYQSAWDISEIDMIKAYAVYQKFADQGISADLWRRIKDDDKIGSKELLSHYFAMFKYGLKTRYYYNSNVASDKSVNQSGSISDTHDLAECESCSL